MPESKPSPSDAEIRQQLYGFLHDVEVLTLGTVDAAGLPHTCILYFVCDPQLRVYFYSRPDTAHCRHIERQPRVAITAVDARDLWEAGSGMQMDGHCRPLGAEEADHVLALYEQKYPRGSWAQRHTAAFKAGRFYRVTPVWARWMNRWRGSDYCFDLSWSENQVE